VRVEGVEGVPVTLKPNVTVAIKSLTDPRSIASEVVDREVAFVVLAA
jgi:hypothetical protein